MQLLRLKLVTSVCLALMSEHMETRSKSKLFRASFIAPVENASLNQVTGASLAECEDQKTNNQTREMVAMPDSLYQSPGPTWQKEPTLQVVF